MLEIMQTHPDIGRIIYANNFYARVGLIHQLLPKKTHFIGTLRRNRRFNQ